MSYTYRVQALDPDGLGNDSDFTLSNGAANLPALPQSPVLDSVTASGATTLDLAWHSSAGDVVNSYRIERSVSKTDPFVEVAVTTGATSTFTDSSLALDTTYYYQVVALNDTGESKLSAYLPGHTRAQSLAAPMGVDAALGLPSQVKIIWNAVTDGSTAVLEVQPNGYDGWQPLGTAAASAGKFVYETDGPNLNHYRVKFVLGAAESPYTESNSSVQVEGYSINPVFVQYLPMVKR